MKGVTMVVTFAIILLVLALIIVFVWGGNISNMLGGINWSDKVLQSHVENQEKELQKLYDDYKNNDGGFDAYESSILLAKAVEFTWTDCYNICKDDRELFTGFFLKNPIDFSRDMDCNNYPISGSGKIYPIIGKIRETCWSADRVTELEVTAWGLAAYTEMCSNYKLNSNEGYKQWGNADCSYHFSTVPEKYCADFCDTGGWGADKIDWQAGEMQKGSKYGNIRIIYSPKAGSTFGIGGEPKIIVKEISESGFDFSLSLNPATASVSKGSSATATVTATLAGGITQPVALSCSSLPPDITCSFNPASITPTSAGAASTLTISTSLTTPSISYPIAVMGTGGSVTASKSFTLVVLS